MLPVHIKSPTAQTQHFFGWLGNCPKLRPKTSMPRDCDIFKWLSLWIGLIVHNHTIFQWLILVFFSHGETQRKINTVSCQITRIWGGGGWQGLTLWLFFFWIAQNARGWCKYHGIDMERRYQRPYDFHWKCSFAMNFRNWHDN